jgi:hypothetical protein
VWGGLELRRERDEERVRHLQEGRVVFRDEGEVAGLGRLFQGLGLLSQGLGADVPEAGLQAVDGDAVVGCSGRTTP